MTTVLTSEDFQSKVLEAENTVLVDFFATWCGPCARIAPVVDEITEELAGKVDVYKVDIDKSSDLARKYGVTSVPTFIVFKEGEITNKLLGGYPKEQILSLLA
ncbi:MAG: thioredoxin [Eggerthellaceae bacterium]|jgi:thioredoxin 1|nr:thioredoxin [Eggerthellaceae bacterium]MDR2715941.1 thioredoxin [Coriobacteriaceae bacterium]